MGDARFVLGEDETGDYCTVDAEPWRDAKEPAMYHAPMLRRRAQERCDLMNSAYGIARRDFGDPARRALLESGLLNLRYRQTVIECSTRDGAVDTMDESDLNEVAMVDRVLKRIGEAVAAIDGEPSAISNALTDPGPESIGVVETQVEVETV